LTGRFGPVTVKKSVVFGRDLNERQMNEPGESIEGRSNLSEFHTEGPQTEKAHDVKLKVNAGLNDN